MFWDENVKRNPDRSPDRHQANKQTIRRSQQRTVAQAKAMPAALPTQDQTDYQQSGLDSQPYLTIPGPVVSGKHPEPPDVPPRRRVSADQIYAAHREARSEARRALKEEPLTEGLLKSRKAVLPSEIRRRERSVEDHHRGHHEDWQSYSSEHRRRSSEEEVWVQERPRERGRDRTVQRIREDRKVDRSRHDGLDERQLQAAGGHRTSSHHYPQLQSVQHVPSGQQQLEHMKTGCSSQIPPRDQDLQADLRSQQDHQAQREEQPSEQQSLKISCEARQQQLAPSGQGTSTAHNKPRSMEMSAGPKPKTRTRSMSDIGVSQHPGLFRLERAAASRESSRSSHPAGLANGDVGTLDTRVSVAQLRHSYLENANRKVDV